VMEHGLLDIGGMVFVGLYVIWQAGIVSRRMNGR
jgi:hypothetical protein